MPKIFPREEKERNAPKAALIFQKHFRGRQTRKKYQILHEKVGHNYKAFVIGNTPVIEGLQKFKAESGSVAIIGISGLRTVLLACQLSHKAVTPKVIIIDNSNQVIEFWRKVRDFILRYNTEDLFLDNLQDFLKTNKELYRSMQQMPKIDGVKYPSQNIAFFFRQLFKSFEFSHIRKIMLGTVVIKQSWSDSKTFVKLKNIIDYHQIQHVFTFPSNIVHYTHIYAKNPIKEIYRILDNIALIKPQLAIHANLSTKHRMPVQVYLVENQDPQHAKAKIFPELPPPSLRESNKTYSDEENAAMILNSIKFQVHGKLWKTTGFFGGDVYGKKPKHAKLLEKEIKKVETKQQTSVQALITMRSIATGAIKKDHEKRDNSTKAFYRLFLPENAADFGLRFIC